MKELVKKYRYWIILYFTLLILNMTIGNFLDDVANLKAVENFGGFFKWLYADATMWSGRLVPAALFELIVHLPNPVFALINTAFLLLLVYGMNKTFAGEELNKSYWPLIEGVLMFVIFIPGLVMSVLWKSATVFYVWCTALSTFMLYPFVAEAKGVKVKTGEWVLCWAGIIYATSFEQIAAFDMVFAVFMVLWNKIYLKRKGFVTPVLALVISALSVFFVRMPGNAVRTVSETIQWMPCYGMFTTDQKVLIGAIYVVFVYTFELAFVMLIIATLTNVLILRSKSALYVKVISVIVDLYYLGAFIENIIIKKVEYANKVWLIDTLYQFFDFYEPDFFFMPYRLWNVIIALTMLFTLGYLLFVAFSNDERLAPEMPLLFLGGICCTMIIGFSPTIHISGERVKFIGYVFTIFTMNSLIREFIKRNGVKV